MEPAEVHQERVDKVNSVKPKTGDGTPSTRCYLIKEGLPELVVW